MLQILLIGVSGSGKSSVGQRLADQLDGEFLDADAFHPSENRRKMAAGIPLTDADRIPWLEILGTELKIRRGRPRPLVLACSALKRSYRERLRKASPGLVTVYLQGSRELIHERMQRRRGHFMKAGMLESQFADLEEPVNAIRVDISQPLPGLVREIIRALPKD
ncbi:MAG: gluconokinase [Oceanipulchritudo sp.]